MPIYHERLTEPHAVDSVATLGMCRYNCQPEVQPPLASVPRLPATVTLLQCTCPLSTWCTLHLQGDDCQCLPGISGSAVLECLSITREHAWTARSHLCARYCSERDQCSPVRV